MNNMRSASSKALARNSLLLYFTFLSMYLLCSQDIFQEGSLGRWGGEGGEEEMKKHADVSITVENQILHLLTTW